MQDFVPVQSVEATLATHLNAPFLAHLINHLLARSDSATRRTRLVLDQFTVARTEDREDTVEQTS